MCRKKKDPNKKGFFAEFKEFITRGNVLDMAVGIIIGGAFTAIVTALTSGILQPIINWALGSATGSLDSARTILGNVIGTDGNAYAAISALPDGVAVDWAATNYIDWGAFISAVINFLLIAFVLFLIIKAINSVHKAGEEAKKKLEEERLARKAEEKLKEAEAEKKEEE